MTFGGKSLQNVWRTLEILESLHFYIVGRKQILLKKEQMLPIFVGRQLKMCGAVSVDLICLVLQCSRMQQCHINDITLYVRF